MHPNTVEAVRVLQDRLRAAEVRDFRQAERYEAALNDLVRNPDRAGVTEHLVRNASSYGRKRAVRRAGLAPRHEPLPIVDDDDRVDPLEELVAQDGADHLVVELRDLISRTPLQPFDRAVMLRLLAGDTSGEVADDIGVPRPRLEVRVSRARARLRAAS